MSSHIVVPVNENGVIFDAGMINVIQQAIDRDPFDYSDVFIYAHGWGNDATQALDEYNRFTIEYAAHIARAQQHGAPFIAGPTPTLGVGIHWPSEVTEDEGSILNDLELLTFYTCEHRADSVGKNAVYSILRILLNARNADAPLRIVLIGHSFGGKVVLSALQDVALDIANNTIRPPQNTALCAILLEPATDNDNLDDGDIYGSVSTIRGLRLLVTHSDLDEALVRWFPAAARLTNLFGSTRHALGAAGPSQRTIAAFGGAQDVTVRPGYIDGDLQALGTSRLVVANLTPVHQRRIADGEYKSPGFSGSHSDINFSELYDLMAAFIYGVRRAGA